MESSDGKASTPADTAETAYSSANSRKRRLAQNSLDIGANIQQHEVAEKGFIYIETKPNERENSNDVVLLKFIKRKKEVSSKNRRSTQMKWRFKLYLVSHMKSFKLFLYMYYIAIKWLAISVEKNVARNLKATVCLYHQLLVDIACFIKKELTDSLASFRELAISSIKDMCSYGKEDYYLTSDEEFDLVGSSEDELELYSEDEEGLAYNSAIGYEDEEEEEIDEETLILYAEIAANLLKKLSSYKICGTAHHGCCSICLEQYRTDEYVRELNCGHSFHVDCVFRWCSLGHFTCPNCRGQLLRS